MVTPTPFEEIEFPPADGAKFEIVDIPFGFTRV